MLHVRMCNTCIYMYVYRHGSELTDEELAELKERQDKLSNQCAQLEQRCVHVHLCM